LRLHPGPATSADRPAGASVASACGRSPPAVARAGGTSDVGLMEDGGPTIKGGRCLALVVLTITLPPSYQRLSTLNLLPQPQQ
jgi:hypothetical protein